MPTPVVEFEALEESIPAEALSSMEIRFRYGLDNGETLDSRNPLDGSNPKAHRGDKNDRCDRGDREVKSARLLPPKSGSLIPLEAEEARRLTATVKSSALAQSPTPDKAVVHDEKRYIGTHDEIEEHFILRLIACFEEHGIETQLYPGDHFSFRFLVRTSPYNTIRTVGNELLSQGFELRVQREKVERPPGTSAVRVSSSGEDWLSFEAGFEIDEDFIPIEDIPAEGIARASGRTYILPPGADTTALFSAIERGRIGRRDLTALEKIADMVSNPEHPAMRDYFSLRGRLSSFSNLRETEVPATFQGSLRPYQKSGLSWLWFLHTYRLGGCLADDMGLGKTIQALALLAKAREAGEMKRALVVCPVSTLGNWMREASQEDIRALFQSSP
ncbi:MAG: SNF2-related protein [Spirochaetaceae bacterium]